MNILSLCIPLPLMGGVASARVRDSQQDGGEPRKEAGERSGKAGTTLPGAARPITASALQDVRPIGIYDAPGKTQVLKRWGQPHRQSWDVYQCSQAYAQSHPGQQDGRGLYRSDEFPLLHQRKLSKYSPYGRPLQYTVFFSWPVLQTEKT